MGSHHIHRKIFDGILGLREDMVFHNAIHFETYVRKQALWSFFLNTFDLLNMFWIMFMTSWISHWRQERVNGDNSPEQSIAHWLSLNHQRGFRLLIGRSFPFKAFQRSDWSRGRRNQFPVYVYVPQMEEGVAVSSNPPRVTQQQGSFNLKRRSQISADVRGDAVHLG